MRLRRYLCLALLCVVTCCALFSVSASAAVVEQYSYNGIVLPKIEMVDEVAILSEKDGVYYLSFYCDDSNNDVSNNGTRSLHVHYFLQNGVWESCESFFDGMLVLWSNYDVVYSDDSIYLSGSEPVITLVEVPDPPPDPVGPSDIASILDAYTGQITVQLVVTVLAGAAGVSVGLVFLWWGVRKVTGALMKAFKKGKLRI